MPVPVLRHTLDQLNEALDAMDQGGLIRSVIMMENTEGRENPMR
jgi:hypothetical protein